LHSFVGNYFYWQDIYRIHLSESLLLKTVHQVMAQQQQYKANLGGEKCKKKKKKDFLFIVCFLSTGD
jgi:hypothetical protein